MRAYFQDLHSVASSEFFTQFQSHIEMRLTEGRNNDEMEKQILRTLHDFDSQHPSSMACYIGALHEQGKISLILPHHSPHNATEHEKAGSPDKPVQVGGKVFPDVIRDYAENYIPNSRFTGCVGKARAQWARFFAGSGNVLKADFLFVCNRMEYAHPGDHYNASHGQNKIYMGNGFHRFIAYGLWLTENNFKPLEMYYVEFL